MLNVTGLNGCSAVVGAVSTAAIVSNGNTMS